MKTTIKAPPHDEATERQVLGTLLLTGECLHEVQWLTPLHFWVERHRLIFRAIQAVSKEHGVMAVEPYNVHRALGERSKQIGGLAGLGEMSNEVISSSHITHHANILRELATLRTIATAASAAAAKAMEGHTKGLEILGNLSAQVLEISSTANTSEGSISFADMAPELEAHLDEEQGAALDTGFPDINRALSGGLRPGDLWVLAGRPSMGKTALACNVAWHASRRCRPTWMASLEMGKKSLALRMIASLASIDYDKVLQPWQMSELERMGYAQAVMEGAANRHLRISELSSGGVSSDLDAICAQAHREQRRCGQLGLIVIDYLQLISVNKFNHRGREAVVSECSRRLKVLAMELEVPVLLLAQVNRKCEERADSRPLLSDLRESGAVEQDADIVSFVYRDDWYYPPGTERPSNAPDPSAFPGCAEILFRKIRKGKSGWVDLLWRGKYQRFDSPVVVDVQPEPRLYLT